MVKRVIKRRKNTARLRRVNEMAKAGVSIIEQNRAGRPPKFHPWFTHIIESLSFIGSTNAQLASVFGVHDETVVSRWMSQHKDFSHAIKRGRAKFDDEVEVALQHRAKGYSHPEEKIFCSEGLIVKAQTTKHYPPDPVSAIFWLHNRRGEHWRRGGDGAVGTQPDDAASQVREALAEIEKKTAGEKS